MCALAAALLSGMASATTCIIWQAGFQLVSVEVVSGHEGLSADEVAGLVSIESERLWPSRIDFYESQLHFYHVEAGHSETERLKVDYEE